MAIRCCGKPLAAQSTYRDSALKQSRTTQFEWPADTRQKHENSTRIALESQTEFA